MNRLEVLSEFGYERDPFRGIHIETSDAMKIKRVVKMAVESRRMIRISAERGCGKTEALSAALKEKKVVEIDALDRERITIGNIERRLISELSSESPKKDRDIRAMQLKRVLGDASKKEEIVLVIDEAHRLHHQTVKSLKGLLNMAWMGVSPLLTIILVGQYDLIGKGMFDDIRLRSDDVAMKGLTASEVKDYIGATVTEHFDTDAIEAISCLKGSKNYLDLQEMLITLMGKALSAGQKTVTVTEVSDVYDGGQKEMIKRTGVSQGELSKIIGTSKATTNAALNNKQGTLTDKKFAETRLAIAGVIRDKAAINN